MKPQTCANVSPSLSFAQEIVVVDSGSTDGTGCIAEAAAYRVVQFEWNGKFPRKKTGLWKMSPLEITTYTNGRNIYPLQWSILPSPDIGTFIEKHNRYSTWEAAAAAKLEQ